MTIYHNGDCEVYINGILTFQATGYTANYTIIDVSLEAKAAICINGNNVIAVKYKQHSGG